MEVAVTQHTTNAAQPADEAVAASTVGERCWRTGVVVALAVFVIDQANKWWFIAGLGLREGVPVPVSDFLTLIYVRNLGVSYGLFQLDSQSGQHILAAIAVLISTGFAVWLAQTRRAATAIAIGLVIGGALGNALDRVLLGGVADFYQLHAFGYSWYIFNIADVAIVLGAGLLVIETFRGDGAEVARNVN